MGACHTFYDELRWDVRDPHQTHVYVYVRTAGDCPHFIQGWHHKAFPSTRPTNEIMQAMWEEDGGPIMWSLKAPPSEERNRTLDEVIKAIVVANMYRGSQGQASEMGTYELSKLLESMKTP